MFRFGCIELKSCRLSYNATVSFVMLFPYFIISIGNISVDANEHNQQTSIKNIFLLHKLLQERVWLDTKVVQYFLYL